MKKEHGEQVRTQNQPHFLRRFGTRLRVLIAIGVMLAALAFWWVRTGSQQQIRTDFLLAAQTRVQVIESELENNFGALRLVRARFGGPNRA